MKTPFRFGMQLSESLMLFVPSGIKIIYSSYKCTLHFELSKLNISHQDSSTYLSPVTFTVLTHQVLHRQIIPFHCVTTCPVVLQFSSSLSGNISLAAPVLIAHQHGVLGVEAMYMLSNSCSYTAQEHGITLWESMGYGWNCITCINFSPQ
jgi:hypothetical protein